MAILKSISDSSINWIPSRSVLILFLLSPCMPGYIDWVPDIVYGPSCGNFEAYNDVIFFQGKFTFASGKQLRKLTISNHFNTKVTKIRGWVSVLIKARLILSQTTSRELGLVGPKSWPGGLPRQHSSIGRLSLPIFVLLVPWVSPKSAQLLSLLFQNWHMPPVKRGPKAGFTSLILSFFRS